MYEFLAQSAAGLPNNYDSHLHKNFKGSTIESNTWYAFFIITIICEKLMYF